MSKVTESTSGRSNPGTQVPDAYSGASADGLMGNVFHFVRDLLEMIPYTHAVSERVPFRG